MSKKIEIPPLQMTIHATGTRKLEESQRIIDQNSANLSATLRRDESEKQPIRLLIP